MTTGFADLETLPRRDLMAVAHEYMLTGMLGVRSSFGPLMLAADRIPEVETLSIDQWMGASPVYTHRMRELMGIEGDDVAAIMKALQLDVGFVHGYMDVVYQIDDPKHAEFWLLHCGALLDTELAGEEQVRFMCHDIEDPTFDATAVATNPRARIRPIHRPPRVPPDRHPHCHWTLVIDDDNEPVEMIEHTRRVGALALASVPNQSGRPGAGKMHDYRGPFTPDFRLGALTDTALAAVASEFQMQSHLLAASVELAVAERSDEGIARSISDDGWSTFGWLLAARLLDAVDLGEGTDRLRNGLALTPAFPPGFDRRVQVSGDHVTLTFAPVHDGIDDPGHPGWVGCLARGVTTGIEGSVSGLGFETTDIETSTDGSAIVCELDVAPAPPDRQLPDLVALGTAGKAASWSFDPVEVEIRR